MRAVNLGPRNRIAMPELRAMFAADGQPDARTHLASGNVVLSSELDPSALALRAERLIADHFGLKVRAVARSRDELAAVIARDPFPDRTVPDKLYQVAFLSEQPSAELVDSVASRAAGAERFAAHGREWYAVLPNGSGRSKLAVKMGAGDRRIVSTVRNWATVKALLAIADESR